MSFKLKNPKCPECGKTAHQVEETMMAKASIDENEDGTFDYAGDSEVNWDSQEPARDDFGGVTLFCECGASWASGMAEEGQEEAEQEEAPDYDSDMLDALRRCIAHGGRFIADEDLAAARAAIANAEDGGVPPLRPGFLTLDTPGERDVTLADDKPFWLTVNGMSIYVRPIEEGVHVEVHEQGYESEGAPFGVIEGRKP